MRKIAHVPVKTWKGWELDLFSWLLGGLWVWHALFFFLCAVASQIFTPCLVPCFTQSINHALKRMQFIAVVDGEPLQVNQK